MIINFWIDFCFVLLVLSQCDIHLSSSSLFSPVLIVRNELHFATISYDWILLMSCWDLDYIIRGFKRWWEFCWMFSRQWLKKSGICHRTVVHRWLKQIERKSHPQNLRWRADKNIRGIITLIDKTNLQSNLVVSTFFQINCRCCHCFSHFKAQKWQKYWVP